MATDEALSKELETSDPDVTLMLQVRDDVPGAFEVLVERYQNRLMGILTHMVDRVEAAEDLTQEVLLRAYRARKGYRPRGKLSTWLFTIASNLAMNHLRGKSRSPTEGLNTPTASGAQPIRKGEFKPPAPGGTATAEVRRKDLAEIVRDAVAALDEDQRMAVLLSKFEGMRYDEIATVLNRPEPVVKSLLARARMDLRERLEPCLKAGEPLH